MVVSYMHTWISEEKTHKQIASGVTHTYLNVYSEKLKEAVYICSIDLQDPYTEVFVASAQGGVTRLETVRNLAQEHLEQQKKVVAAINGDFFSALGVPSGLQIVNGEIICSPLKNKVAMAIMEDRSVRLLQQIQMEAWVRLGNEFQLSVDAVNRTRGLAQSDHLHVYTTRFGTSTNTPAEGVEVVLELTDSQVKLKPAQTITAKVLKIIEGGNSSIPPQGLILSATGQKAEWLRRHLVPGVFIELHVSYDQGVNQARQVLSGNSTLAYPLLNNGELAPEIVDKDNPFYSDRHPRTMLATKAGKLYTVVVDGRQPGYSDGMTLAESAYYLQTLGMEQAINIDGGGSSTCLIRPLGQSTLYLANTPSDGFERAVGNGLIITNTASQGSLAKLLLEPEGKSLVLQGSTLQCNVRGIDQYLNPIPIVEDELTWELEGAVGRIRQGGRVEVVNAQETGLLKVRLGHMETAVQLTCTDTIENLILDVDSAILEPGSTVMFRPRATDGEGNEILLSPDALTWSVEGEIGAINGQGELIVSSDTNSGSVIARYRSCIARKDVQVGQEPLVLVDFESSKGLDIRYKNVVFDSVKFSQTSRPHPIRFGAFAGRVTYDFTGQVGHSSVFIDLLDEKGEVGRAIAGNPKKFGIWVYGDGQKHWLRLITTDGADNKRNLDFTPLGGLDWVGWRYVTVDVPTNTVYPIKVLSIALVEPNDANKNAGTIYLDNFRAEYVNIHEDVAGPILGGFKPAPQSIVTTELQEVSLYIRDDDSGINPNSIQMWVNQRLVAAQYDKEHGILSYVSEEPFAEGEYKIQIYATDNAGNPNLPVDWTFRRITDSSTGRECNAKQVV